MLACLVEAAARSGPWAAAPLLGEAAGPVLRAVEQEHFLLRVLVQLAVIVAAARLGGWLATRIGQPVVVGEIATGLILGPSVLGGLFPDLLHAVFPPDEPALRQAVSTIGQIGLVLLMFLIGLEFEASHLRHIGGVSAGVAVAGIALPMLLGGGLAWAIQPLVAAEVDRLDFTLIVGTAVSITAIPVLGRILLELGLQRTRVGSLAMSAAAIDDVLGWVLLAGVTASVTVGFSAWKLAAMLAGTAVFVAAVAWVVRPLLARLIPESDPAPLVPEGRGLGGEGRERNEDRGAKIEGTGIPSRPSLPVPSLPRRPRPDNVPRPSGSAESLGAASEPADASVNPGNKLSGLALTVVLAVVLLAAIVTNAIGIHSVFGPFLLGVFLADRTRLREAMRTSVGDFVAVAFLPIFFVTTGLGTDVGTLSSGWLWGLAGLVLLTASVGKMLGTGLVARVGGLSWREAGCVAVMMNTRGLMGLIAINVGRDLGLIPDSVFCMLVLMAVVTTFATTPLLRLLLPPGTRRPVSAI